MFHIMTRSDALSSAAKYRLMSATCVSSPGVPGMCPSSFNGVGTVADAGR